MTSKNTTKNSIKNKVHPKAHARILADGVYQSNNTHVTGLNNNDLIIGPTGAGKTRGYVIPNLIHNSGESFVVADTKGNLHKAYGNYLRSQGYEVAVIDFVDCLHSPNGYDPIRGIRYDQATGRYNEQDILRVCTALCPVTRWRDDPYWEQAAQMNLASLIALTLERYTEEDHSLSSVCYLATRLGSAWLEEQFDDLATSDSDSFAVQEHRLCTINKDADKMIASVMGILVNALQPMSFNGAKHLFECAQQVDMKTLGHKKTALFLTVSDNDRSLDRLVNAFYTQALQELMREADRLPECALPIPVRFILDDFATNTKIPDFDKVITTIRSRNISVDLIVQDLTQLYSLYGEAVGSTIANNCDTWLYLGGQDVYTAEMLSKKLGRTVDTVLALTLDDAFLFVRGSNPVRVRKYNLESDATYKTIRKGCSRRKTERSKDCPSNIKNTSAPQSEAA